ncbi:MAG TPA: sensor histidine kinase, partial [Clostridia bacterium]
VSIENARLYNCLKISSEEIEASRNEISQLNRDLEIRVEERTKQLQILNNELADRNRQLKHYADTIEELSVIRERNRMAKDVHDTLGHSMTLLLTLLEVCKISCTKDVGKTMERLDEAAEIARSGLANIRRSISGLLPEELEENDVVKAIENLINTLKYTGVKFNFSVGRMDIKISTRLSSVIFRVCQESITNALRYGEPTEIDIVLKLSNSKIKLYIVDDGTGCKEIKEGVGLKGMRQRLESVEGTLKYGSDGQRGFHIYAEIPFLNAM